MVEAARLLEVGLISIDRTVPAQLHPSRRVPVCVQTDGAAGDVGEHVATVVPEQDRGRFLEHQQQIQVAVAVEVAPRLGAPAAGADEVATRDVVEHPAVVAQ